MATDTLILSYAGVTFDVEFGYSPARQAYTSGPPEDCHPAEGGFEELLSVTVEGSDQDLSDVLSQACKDNLIEQINTLAAEPDDSDPFDEDR